MSTPRDLIKAAMRKIGAVASGETPSADELSDGLSAFNAMLDSFSNERLVIPSVTEETFPLIAGQATYTMGPNGDFNTTRPMAILLANMIDQDLAEYPIALITLEDWAQITVKNTQNPLPTKLYVEDTYPKETLHFWPVPSAVRSVILRTWKPLTTFTSLSTSISLPPGYEEMLVYNLAIRMAPEYGKAVSAEVSQIALDSKENIKRKNVKVSALSANPAGTSQTNTFNILIGS